MYVHMCIATAGTTKRGETDVQLPSVQNQFLECCHVGTVALFDGPQFLDLDCGFNWLFSLDWYGLV